MRRTGVVLATMLAAAAGCSSGSNPSISDPRPGGDMATVTFRAGWPTAAGKSLVDWNDTGEVAIYVEDESGSVADCSLTPVEPTCTLVLPAGFYAFYGERYDLNGIFVEGAGIAGKLIPGSNTVAMTFLSGEWTFDSPITLSDGTTTIQGFSLGYPGAGVGVAAFEENVPALSNEYGLSYLIDEGSGLFSGVTRIRHLTQFGGGTLNRSALEGAGYSLTQHCGEQYDGPYDGSCAGDGGPGGDPSERWIRILGDTGDDMDCGGCNESERAVRRLLPGETYDPDIRPFANASVSEGTQIAGTLIEYQFGGGSVILVEGATGPVTVPAAPLADPEFDVTAASYRPVIICREGFNGGATDDGVQTGDWVLEGGVDLDDDLVEDYYERGWLTGANVGECNWGLEPADPGDVGEVCELQYGCDSGNGVVEFADFEDRNGDGRIDTGSFFFSHYLKESFNVYGHAYPFTATGTAAPQGTSFSIE